MSAGDSAYVPKLKEIWAVLEHHIETEESEDLPALEKALSSEENRGSSESLAKNFGRTKAFVPSRSHPAAGENPYVTPMYELHETYTDFVHLLSGISKGPWACSPRLLTTSPISSASSPTVL
jgi:hypothetical protein